MDLLINYGTNASAGGQPVIAEIQLTQAQQSVTTTESITDSGTPGYWNVVAGETGTTTNSSYRRSIQRYSAENVVSIASTTGTTQTFGWYDENDVSLGYTSSSGSVTPISGAVTFAWYAHVASTTYSSTITVTKTIPEVPGSATTTFYDSYPGGNVIGTTNGTQVGGTDYNISYSDNTIWDPNQNSALTITSNSGWSSSTEKIEIIDNQILFTTPNFSMITFYSNGGNTFLGYYAEWPNYTGYLGNISPITNVTIPTGATHFALSASKDNTNFDPNYSFAQIQQTKLQHGEVTQLSFTFQNSGYYDGATFVSLSGIATTGNIPIQDNWTIILNNTNFNRINWKDSNYTLISNAGWTASGQIPPTAFTPPAGSVYVEFNGDYRSGYTRPISYTDFQTLTVSYLNPSAGYLQIDPPTGKRIKQIALKGL